MSKILKFDGKGTGKEYRINQEMLDELATISRGLHAYADREPDVGQVDELRGIIEYMGEILSAVGQSPAN